MGATATCVSDDCKPCCYNQGDASLKFPPPFREDDAVEVANSLELKKAGKATAEETKEQEQQLKKEQESREEQRMKTLREMQAAEEERTNRENQRLAEEEKKTAEEAERQRLLVEEEGQKKLEEEEARMQYENELDQQRRDAEESDREYQEWLVRDTERRKLAAEAEEQKRLDAVAVSVMFRKAKGGAITVSFRRNLLCVGEPPGIEFDKEATGHLKVQVKQVGPYAASLGVEAGMMMASINGTDLGGMHLDQVIVLFKERLWPLPKE